MRLVSKFKTPDKIRSINPLTDDEILQVAPSVFANCAHESRSERYTYIPTIQVISALRTEGFQPFEVCQTRVRTDERKSHTKHMIRLRHASDTNKEEANEIVLLNSHDGTSSYQMLAGMFRFVCANGMVCGDTISDIRVRHKGDIQNDVIEAAFTILEQFESVENQREEMKMLELSKDEQNIFANAALALKYDDLDNVPITSGQILVAKRGDDLKNNLWTTFNKVQENLIRGGVQGKNKSGKNQRTRPVKGIDANIKLNKGLWILAEEMKKLKS